MTFSFIFIMDIIGTIAFAISGAMEGIRKNMDIFGINILALATGVGGGLIRDIMANRTPQIFVKHIYALVSVIGALITSVSYMIFDESTSVIIGFISIILIRCAAARYKLNLPRIKHK